MQLLAGLEYTFPGVMSQIEVGVVVSVDSVRVASGCICSCWRACSAPSAGVSFRSGVGVVASVYSVRVAARGGGGGGGGCANRS